MRLFDLHCDTPTRLLSEKQALLENSCHISLSKARYLDKYAQVSAVWTDNSLSDEEGYTRFFEVLENFRSELAKNSDEAVIVDSYDKAKEALDNLLFPFIISVEDARILAGDLSRLDILRTNGVRILTLNWSGLTCIGGAHNTSVGLTDFGKSVVNRCFDIGIIPDISHCSFKGAEDALALACERRMPVIASHSDSYSVTTHSRNLRDDHFRAVSSLGGLVGISLCPSHLSSSNSASLSDIMKHIEHYLSIGGESTIVLGCDLDGTDLPHGFDSISDIYKIADEMQRLNYSTELTDRILFRNAFDFFGRNL